LAQLVRHQLGATLLEELRQAGLGVRDLFEGRQEPLSWYFRGLAYDQSELDILESGAVDTLHAPSALVELVVDEMALACANLGIAGVASYLDFGRDDVPPPELEGERGIEPRRTTGVGAGHTEAEVGESGTSPLPEIVGFHPEVMLGYVNVDVAPPARWLEHREADPRSNERFANRLAEVAREVGGEADSVEVHIEGALDAGSEWDDGLTGVRPAGVSLYYSFDMPLAGAEERSLARIFGRVARTAAATLERMRAVFREED